MSWLQCSCRAELGSTAPIVARLVPEAGGRSEVASAFSALQTGVRGLGRTLEIMYREGRDHKGTGVPTSRAWDTCPGRMIHHRDESRLSEQVMRGTPRAPEEYA